MHFAKLKQFPTSFDSQNFYIDPSFLSLLKRNAYDDNIDFLKELIEAIANEHTGQSDLYLDRVLLQDDKNYKVLVHDGSCVKPLVVDLSNPKNGEKPVISVSETTTYPDELNPFSAKNIEWLAPNLREGIRRFEQERPTAPVIFTAQNYTIERATQQFPLLAPYADIHKKCLAQEEKLCQHLQAYNLLIQSIPEVEDGPRTQQFFELFDHLSKTSYQHREKINETLNSLSVSLSDKFAKYCNNQEKLRCVKVYLAWAFYITVAHTQGKIKTEKFNTHFENVIRIDPEGITDIRDVCDTFIHWPLEKIEIFINTVMSAPYDDTVGWDAEKQKELMKNINEKAAQLKTILDLNNLPCTAYSSRIPFKAPIFSLNEMKKVEQENQTILTAVNTLAESNKYQNVKQLDIEPVAKSLNTIEDKLRKYTIIVADYKKILAQRKAVIVAIEKKAKTLQSWVEKLGVNLAVGTKHNDNNLADSKPLAAIKERIQKRIQSIQEEAAELTIPMLENDDSNRNKQLEQYKNECMTLEEKIEMLDRQKSDIKYLVDEIQKELIVISKEIDEKYPILELDPLLSKTNRQLGDDFSKNKKNYIAARTQIERLKRNFVDQPDIFSDKLRGTINEAQKKIAQSYQELQISYINMATLIKSASPPLQTSAIDINANTPIELPKAIAIPTPVKPPAIEAETQTLNTAALPLPKTTIPPAHFPKQQTTQPGFFTRHKKAIVVGGVASLFLGGVAMVALAELGLTATLITAIGAGTAKVAGLFGFTLSETTNCLLGLGVVTAGISALGSALGVIGSKAISAANEKSPSDPGPGDLELGYRSTPTRNAFLHQQMGRNYRHQSSPLNMEDFADLMPPRDQTKQQVKRPEQPEPAAPSQDYRSPSCGM